MTIHSAQRKAAALAPTLMAAAILGTLGAPAHGQAQQQEQNLPEVRVNAQAASATTEGNGSYTSGSMTAATPATRISPPSSTGQRREDLAAGSAGETVLSLMFTLMFPKLSNSSVVRDA